MSWLDTLKGRAQEAKGRPASPAAAKPRPPKREVKVAWFQTAAPRDGDCGTVEAAHYFVVDGVVTLCDERGKSSGRTAVLAENDDPRMVAARMGRAAWLLSSPGSDFNRRLNYRPLGIA